ncbi:MAG: hypothetical protein JXB19_08370 [Bacteroidales bacterium]|nr:hypothetical protein [Bacteroidales bacterium]
MYRETFHPEFIEIVPPPAESPEYNGQNENTAEKNEHKKPKVRIKELIDGTILVREDTKRQLPYIIFLTFLGIIYIGNRFYAERVVRQISEIKTEVTNLRAEQITTTAELMNISRPSEVTELIRERNLGLVESVEPPKKLVRK